MAHLLIENRANDWLAYVPVRAASAPDVACWSKTQTIQAPPTWLCMHSMTSSGS